MPFPAHLNGLVDYLVDLLAQELREAAAQRTSGTSGPVSPEPLLKADDVERALEEANSKS